jgi:methionyl-tRNA formyltransferase
VVAERLVYLGTPELAVPPLEALVAAGHDVALVVTRPDRRRGRGGASTPSPVKAAAERLGLPVVHRLDEVATHEAGPVERGVVVAYGRIIPEALLAAVPMVNLHFSLLPRWRGAAPVERAILAGDPTTGVCLMGVEAGLDTGPVLARTEVEIGPHEHLSSLRARLVDAGCELLLAALAAGLGAGQPQAGTPTYAEKLERDELDLRWDRPAVELERVVRLDQAFTTWRGRHLRVLDARGVPAPDGAAVAAPPPGSLVGDEVVTGDGRLRLLAVQAAGSTKMAAADWLRGAHPQPGDRFARRDATTSEERP